jgi:hypothetical protein
MTFELIFGVACLCGTLVFGYMWKGPPSQNMSPEKLARARRAALGLFAFLVIAVIRLASHTYK